MNSNKPVRRFDNTLTKKQANFLKIYNKEQTKPSYERLPQYKIAEQAGYQGNTKTLSVASTKTVQLLRKKGLITSLEDNKVDDNYLAKALKQVVDSGLLAEAKASDAVNALRLILKARGDLDNEPITAEETLKAELKGLTEDELSSRLAELRSRKVSYSIQDDK